MTETTGELNATQLAKLLEAALGDDNPAASGTETDAQRAEALAAALECPLPGAGRDISDVLLGETAALDGLRAVKDLGRRMVESPSELDRPAGTVLYYAAIARALRDSGERITRHDPQTLALSLADLAAREWIPTELRTLFTTGQAACAADQSD
jgi:hypothetical protein